MKKRQTPRVLRLWALVICGAITIWFFSQVWSNVSTLASRTLPGVALAAEMAERATELELTRNEERLEPRHQAAFVEIVDAYESTVAIERDRLNCVNVRRAYSDYTASPSRETWLNLRGEIKVLLSFRLQRAQSFANDSRDRFTMALGVNAAGLAIFGALVTILSLSIGMSRSDEVRPDDF